MKTALITTTINVPTVLELYRCHGSDVAFFVAGDEKTPVANTPGRESCVQQVLGLADPNWFYYSPENQKGWKCSELIGWNCIQRRNIALLEAIKWGADVIVSIDDDNIPMNADYFESFERLFAHTPATVRTRDWQYQVGEPVTFNGLKVSSPNGWFDVGTLLDPVAPHRGFPYAVKSQAVVSHVVEAKVGVAAGICLGDPDIAAVTRIVCAPEVHRVSELLNSGIVVDPGTKTVFNSQNTAFIRELAPAMFMMPGVGRYDDIYASLICQRVMRERGLHVHFGKPFVWQQRNPHNLTRDLRQEVDGMENVERFAKLLDIKLEVGASIRDHVAQCYNELENEAIVPKQSTDAAFAFLEDIEQVMG